MAEYRGLDVIDYFIVIVKWKKFLIILALLSLILGYLAVYFLIPPRYKATATIISAESSQANPLGALAKKFSSLPISSLGMGAKSSAESYDLFTTLIYSRSNLEEMIKKFNLQKEYHAELMSDAIKQLTENIETDVTKESAYNVTVLASTPEKSAKMTNYLVDKVNKTVIELNISKSKNNRIFLEERYNEIKTNLAIAEDSLRYFQQKTGVLEAENQTKATIEAYTKLESELAVKEVETSVVSQLYGENSPQVKAARISADEFSNRIKTMKNKSSGNNLLMPLNSLPANVLQYYRYYRDLEIQNAMLEYIIPMYEQARYEEIKNIPVLQIIDYAVPADKKSYPPRALFSVLIMIVITFFCAALIIFREVINNTTNDKVLFLKRELLHFRK